MDEGQGLWRLRGDGDGAVGKGWAMVTDGCPRVQLSTRSSVGLERSGSVIISFLYVIVSVSAANHTRPSKAIKLAFSSPY